MDERDTRESVAATAQMMARAGLTEGFGHVSMRYGEGFAITSVTPLLVTGPNDVLLVPDMSDPPSGGEAALETPMHAALYAARPDISAVCRGHSPAAVAWGLQTQDLPLLHGLGGLAGRRVGVHPEAELIRTVDQGMAVASTLGNSQSLIIRANGSLAVGASPLEALTRLYFLEERARVAAAAPDDLDPIDWGTRHDNLEAELQRAMAWVAAAFGAEHSP